MQFRLQVTFSLLDACTITVLDDYIIYIHDKDYAPAALCSLFHKHRDIINTSHETKFEENAIELVKSCTRGLFQIINRLPKLTHFVGLPLSNKTRWLLHVNLLLKVPM